MVTKPTITNLWIKDGFVNVDNNAPFQMLSGRADPNALIGVYLNGGASPAYTVTADSLGRWSKVIGALPDGSYSYIAIASVNGAFSAPSAQLDFIVDTQPPAAPALDHIASAKNAARDSGFSVSAGAAVQIFVGDRLLTDAEAAASFTKSTAGNLDSYFATNGVFTGSESIRVTATQTDPAGNRSVAQTLQLNPITALPMAPSLGDSAIVSGFVNAARNTNAQELTGLAPAGAEVVIYRDNVEQFRVTAGSDGRWSQLLGVLQDGAYSFSATATIGGETSPRSAPLAFKVDTAPPPAPTLSHVAGSVSNSDRGFSVTAGSVVEVVVAGQKLTSDQLAADFTKTSADGVDTYLAKAGAFTATASIVVSATQADEAGNVSLAQTLNLNPLDTASIGDLSKSVADGFGLSFASRLLERMTGNAFIIGDAPTAATPQLIFDPALDKLIFDPDGTGPLASQTFATDFSRSDIAIGDHATANGPQLVFDPKTRMLSVDMDGVGDKPAVELFKLGERFHLGRLTSIVSELFSDRAESHCGDGWDDYWRGHSAHSHGSWGGEQGHECGEEHESELRGGRSDDALAGTDRNDWIKGRSGNDVLSGLAGEDHIYGGRGDDRLSGGPDADILKGGPGKDIFTFDTPPVPDHADIIRDFVAADDVIQLVQSSFSTLDLGPLSDNAFYSAADATTAQTADQRIIFNQSTGALSFDADGSKSGFAPIQFAKLDLCGMEGTLTAGDFQVVK